MILDDWCDGFLLFDFIELLRFVLYVIFCKFIRESGGLRFSFYCLWKILLWGVDLVVLVLGSGEEWIFNMECVISGFLIKFVEFLGIDFLMRFVDVEVEEGLKGRDVRVGMCGIFVGLGYEVSVIELGFYCNICGRRVCRCRSGRCVW